MTEIERTHSPYTKALACSVVAFALAIGAFFLGYTLPSLKPVSRPSANCSRWC